MKRNFFLPLVLALTLTGCGAASSAVLTQGSGTIDCTGSGEIGITTAGSYTLTGTLDGSVVVDVGEGDVELILDGLTVTSPDGPALWVRDAGSVTLTLADGSQNSLADSTLYSGQTDEEPNAAVFCDADLTIRGGGALSVTGHFDHAVRCKEALTVEDGALELSAVGKALKGREALRVTGGRGPRPEGFDGERPERPEDVGKMTPPEGFEDGGTPPEPPADRTGAA